MLAPTSPPRAKPGPAWAGLLERFYAPAGLPLPQFRQIQPEEMPEPYKTLLVHSSDMTSALERFYQEELRLKVLGRERLGPTYSREVIINLANGGRPVEFGAIRIGLDHLTAEAKEAVLREERPLGSILRRENIAHLSSPQAFFHVQSDAHIGAVLGLRRTCALYGRHNLLRDTSGNLLAEVIEILAPAIEDGR